VVSALAFTSDDGVTFASCLFASVAGLSSGMLLHDNAVLADVRTAH